MVRFANQGHKIFAIDVGNKDEAIAWAKRLKQNQDLISDVFAIKIGLLDVIHHGLSIINQIGSEAGLPVICDLKLAEIPTIAKDIAKKVADAGAFGIVIQGFVGEEVLKMVQEATKESGLKIFLVSEMSHEPHGGFTHLHLEAIADIAKRYKVFGIIGPGNRESRLKIISEIIKDSDVRLIAAGIQKGTNDEENARKAGANLFIEGHIIREALEKNSVHSIEQPENQVRPIIKILGIFIIVGSLIAYLLSDKWLELGALGSIAVSGGFALTSCIISLFVNRKHNFFR
ncbi:MAG: orotidine-5'-phosphate decarboxylase [Nitrospirae bacterium]|nr:orotidine-5'-phosphate decarboxylase [Nitrospirota bacterium]